ncbi:MAG: phosphatidate cytidylyltransferase, partial [Acidobacteriota bacterium]
MVLATAMALLVFLASESAFRGALAAVGALAALEMRRLAHQLAPSPALWLMVPVVPALAAWQWGWLPIDANETALLLFLFGVAPAVAALLSSRGGDAARDPQNAPVAASLLCFGAAYLASAVVALAGLHGIDRWLVFLVVAIVGTSDTAAYYGGKATGRNKLAPSVSPNKTVEGSLWGLVCAVLAVAIYSLVRLDGLDPIVLGAGALTAVAGQIGDLVESLFKRSAGVKDSGNLLPGHGGVVRVAEGVGALARG